MKNKRFFSMAIAVLASLLLALMVSFAGYAGSERAQAGVQNQDAGLVVSAAPANKATVYFTDDISPSGLMAVYNALERKPDSNAIASGKVAVKITTGEPPNSNYLRPELIKDLVQSVNGTIVESNTAYPGKRINTAFHKQVAKDHGFTAIADVDILDEDGSVSLPVRGGNRLTENFVGAHFKNYDYYVILSHFKGHAMAGLSGAIKNISIGIASSEGKIWIHTGGASKTDAMLMFGTDQNVFLDSMAEAGKAGQTHQAKESSLRR
jgi:uncharacterized Fe-S center protein